MITEYLFAEEEERRLSEIVDELASNEYIRRILDFNPEPEIDWGDKLQKFQKSIPNISDDLQYEAETELRFMRIVFRIPKLQVCLVNPKYNLFLSVADILLVVEKEGYTFSLHDKESSNSIIEKIKRYPNYLQLVRYAEQQGFVDEERAIEEAEETNLLYTKLGLDFPKKADDFVIPQFLEVNLEAIAMITNGEREIHFVGDHFLCIPEGGSLPGFKRLFFYESGGLFDLQGKLEADSPYPSYSGLNIFHDQVRDPYVYNKITRFLRHKHSN